MCDQVMTESEESAPPNANNNNNNSICSCSSNSTNTNKTMPTSSSSSSKRKTKKSSEKKNPFGPVIGELKSSFSCQYNDEKGTLYVATLAICFRRTAIFGLEASREIIPWRTVHSLYNHNENGFSVQTFAGKVYSLKNIETNVEYTLQLCTKVWENAKKNQSPKYIINDENTTTCSRDSNNNNPQQQQRDVMEYIHRTFSTDGSRDAGDDDDDEETILSAERGVIDFISTSLGACLKGKHDQTYDTGSEDSGLSFQSQMGHEVKYDDFAKDSQIQAQAWRDFLDTQEPSFQMTPFVNLYLKYDIDQFYDLYVADNAPFSLANFHQNETTDYDVKNTPWEDVENDSFTRTITYTHPNTAPMAPPSSFSTKTQQLTKYGRYGMCINTQTIIQGVPMADTFYIEDRLIVEAQADDNGVLVSALFDVRFNKSTIFRKIIERNSKSEVNELLVTYGEYLESTSMSEHTTTTRGIDEDDQVKTICIVESSTMEDVSLGEEEEDGMLPDAKTNSSLSVETEVNETESFTTTASSSSSLPSSGMQILIVILTLFQMHSMYQLQQANNRISFLEGIILEGNQCGV